MDTRGTRAPAWESQFSSSVEDYVNDQPKIKLKDGTEKKVCSWCGDPPCNNTCCYQTCKYLLELYGVTEKYGRLDMAEFCSNDKNYSCVKPTNNFENGLKILDEKIVDPSKGGRPVLVGVHYLRDKEPYNTNPATRHYIVIVGKGYDKILKKNYYRFYDVGRSEENESDASDEDNKLFTCGRCFHRTAAVSCLCRCWCCGPFVQGSPTTKLRPC